MSSEPHTISTTSNLSSNLLLDWTLPLLLYCCPAVTKVGWTPSCMSSAEMKPSISPLVALHFLRARQSWLLSDGDRCRLLR